MVLVCTAPLRLICVKTWSPAAGSVLGATFRWEGLKQWLSTFLTLQPFNTVLHAVATPNLKLISLLPYNWGGVVLL